MIESSTTIAISTNNNANDILYTLERLSWIIKKHNNIKKILIIDNNSKDKTTEVIIKYMSHRDKKNLISLFCLSKKINEKNLINKILQNTITTNIIFIEPEMYTFPRQITTMIYKLQKVEAIIPTRFHKQGVSMFKNKQTKKLIEKKNEEIRRKYQLNIKDPTTTIKAFRTKTLYEINHEIKKANHYWIQIYKQVEEKKIRITQMKIEQNCIRKNLNYNPENFLKKN